MQKTITLQKTWDFDDLNQELTLTINNDDFINLVNTAKASKCTITDFDDYQITEDPYSVDLTSDKYLQKDYLEYDYKELRIYNDCLELSFRDKHNEELAIYEYKVKSEDLKREPSLVRDLKVMTNQKRVFVIQGINDYLKCEEPVIILEYDFKKIENLDYSAIENDIRSVRIDENLIYFIKSKTFEYFDYENNKYYEDLSYYANPADVDNLNELIKEYIEDDCEDAKLELETRFNITL